MRMLRKAKAFLFLDPTTRKLLIEAYALLGWARILKLLPFSRVSAGLGRPMSESSYAARPADVQVLRSIAEAIQVMSRYTFWESQCLVQAIAAMKMLERRRLECTLYLGTAKDGEKFIAHAWLRSGPYYLTGYAGKDKFAVVHYFAKKGFGN